MIKLISKLKRLNMRSNKGLIVCILFFVLFLLIPIVLQDNSYVTIHDNLDSEIAWRVVLAESGKAFTIDPREPVEQIMNGIPRGCLPSGLNVIVWLFLILKPFTAYLMNYILVHCVAFIGMYLLLRKHLIPEEKDLFISNGVSLCFALLPFYTMYGLSIAGQPLLIYSIINILKKKEKLSDFLIIGLFPFYSSLVYIGVFIILALILFLAIDFLRNKRINGSLALGTCLLLFFYIIVESNLLSLLFLDPNFVPHRAAWNGSGGLSMLDAVRSSFDNFIHGQYHAASLHDSYVLPAVIFALALCFFRKKANKPLLYLISAILLISFWYGFSSWAGLSFFKERIPLLCSFQWDRVHWFHPVLWYAAFVFALAEISKIKYGKYISIILIVLQLNLLVTNSDTQAQIEQSTKLMRGQGSDLISFKRFFSPSLFNNIGSFIGKAKKDYRIISVGIHPAVAQYNGFYTLDGYQNNYPLQYKIEFRKIIAKELEKSKKWKEYYDDWGSKCYMFSSELDGLYIRKERKFKIKDLELNTAALRSMGGKYIFSAVEILNSRQNGLSFIKRFEDERSPWEIYLYKVN